MENADVADPVLMQGVRVTQQYAVVEHLHIREGHMHDFWMLLDFFFERGDRVQETGVEEANAL